MRTNTDTRVRCRPARKPIFAHTFNDPRSRRSRGPSGHEFPPIKMPAWGLVVLVNNAVRNRFFWLQSGARLLLDTFWKRRQRPCPWMPSSGSG
jgi:hypothetical protein